MNQGDTKGKSILDRGDIKYKSSVLRKSQEVRLAVWDGQRQGEGDEAGSARARSQGACPSG